ncbi:lantibiotic dehydratase [Streptomyces daliensis]
MTVPPPDPPVTALPNSRPTDREPPAAHLVPLGATGWHVWRDVLVRGAGFPARLVDELADPDLARTADALLSGTVTADAYHRAFDTAVARFGEVVRRTAADGRFREAVAWQNHALLPRCLDKAVPEAPRNSKGREHQETIVNYLQRYALKNDTIGFFGPTAWGQWTRPAGGVCEEGRLRVEPGRRFLRHRAVYFESWAVDAVAQALGRDPGMTPWLLPRRDPNVAVEEGGLLRRASGSSLQLSPAQAALLQACDGKRPAVEVARELAGPGLPYGSEAEAMTALNRLLGERLITLGLEGPLELHPEITLRDKLRRIGDRSLRNKALADLDRLLGARAYVAAPAGDAERLAAALDRLNTEFEQVTGMEAGRLHGQTYAARTLVFEETVRDVHVELGTALRAELAGPLGLVLDSARWLANRIAAEYGAYLFAAHRDWTAAHPGAAMPLVELLEHAGQKLGCHGTDSDETRAATVDFQQRWRHVLGAAARPETGMPAQLSSGMLADRVRAAFPAARPAHSAAVHHAPDVMIAAASEAAVRRGEYEAVLGEVHAAFNTLEHRSTVEHHPDPEALRGYDAADHGGRRIYLVPPKKNLLATTSSRLSPPTAMPAPDTVYWSTCNPSIEPPGRFLALADLFVHATDEPGALEVRDGAGTFRAPLLDVLSEPLSDVTATAFQPFPRCRHRGRVTVDRLVVAREAWTLPAAELTWADQRKERGERERFLAARAWRVENGLPERVFAKTPGEIKPFFVDFGSIPLVNLFARAVRRAAAKDAEAQVTLTEVLPDTHQTWLTDDLGERYSCELRMIAVDPLSTER